MAVNIYTILVYLGIFSVPALIFVILTGGSYLKMRIKAKMPWSAGKGKNHLAIDKTGVARWDYVVLRKGNVLGKGDEAIRVEGNHHSLLDLTKLDKHTTIHQLDKEPLIITVEGAPTDVLVQQRDYDEDISKLNYIIKNIDTVLADTNQEDKIKLQKNLIVMFNKLLSAFKYLDPAKKICYYVIKKTKEDESAREPMPVDEVLKFYKLAIQNILSVMKKRNHTMINFTDYFTEINLSRIFNSYFKDANQLGRREALIGVQKENQLQKIGGIILILGMLFIGYMVYDMSGKMKDQTESLNSLATSITELNKILVNPDTNTINLPNSNSNTIPPVVEGNPITGGS